MKKVLLLLSLCLFVTSIQAQKEQVYQNESKTHIGWQPDRRLTKEDYQGDFYNDPRHQKYCDKVGLCVNAATGVFYRVDARKGRYKPGKYYEKLYVSPLFQKNISCYSSTADSLDFAKQQLVFDIDELTARYMKYQFHHFLDSFNLHCDNECTFFFLSFYEEAMAIRDTVIARYSHDVYLVNREGAYDEWRQRVDQLLDTYKDYATTPEEVQRILFDKPLDKKLKLAKSLMPSWFAKQKQKEMQQDEK
ncbi:MAG: hypothetical protein VZQ98_19330 [Bacteroidales bacterium]|nr:hypothetical protein [Bacteroidales bacterium]